MIAEKRKFFFSFLFKHTARAKAWLTCKRGTQIVLSAQLP